MQIVQFYVFKLCLPRQMDEWAYCSSASKKGGFLNDANNYRGITLTNIFSKIFSILLERRLSNWAEANEKLNDFQFGFRKNKSTIDCVILLTSLIDKIVNHEKKKLYCSFIEFRKAFDLVNRNGLWVKLIKYDVSTKIVRMIQKIYENVKLNVKVHGSVTDSFCSNLGVKQGEPLSPLLFYSLSMTCIYLCMKMTLIC